MLLDKFFQQINILPLQIIISLQIFSVSSFLQYFKISLMQNQLQLPIIQYRQKILKSIQSNRVVVISGRTGCGKSTQVPKYILLQNPNAKIAVCQPRRLAATCLANRVSEQLDSQLGTTVGYQIGMQYKYNENTKIIYMTYGILIQQLLFQSTLDYTHIILDQVHQRSLEMDFTFIALKKILDNQKKKQTKVIIMSATINSIQFAKHFSTHKVTKEFLKPIITYTQQKRMSTRSNRRSREQPMQLQACIKFQRQDYVQAQCIQLPDKNKFKIIQHFANQIHENQAIPEYTINQDVRVREDTFKIAVKLIQQHLKTNQGDMLIFVPGMFQIKFLKQLLLTNAKIQPNQIVEVHSAYSDELFKRLFIDKVKNKVIIATNIGQSSITLPFCKVVIDFCLTRKNITQKTKGYSRFQTRVASKANLMQRAGRVGRISDGTVYRLIARSMYNKLDDFDIPEIQCVSLDMAILRAKQIDKTYNSNLFQDIYQVFFNAIQPPKFNQVHSAIQYLIQQQALMQLSKHSKNIGSTRNSQKQKMNKIFNVNDLKITKTGQFMVTMPCNIRISKMILHSLQFGITYTMIDIAAILLTQKQFFLHEQKRFSVQEWMHSIIGYDRGDYNDFLLRQRMFSHWRSLYYQPFKKEINRRRYKTKQHQKQKEQSKKHMHVFQTQKILQQFNNQRITQKQWDFCNDRGISPWVMRDILRISQNIQQRLYQQQIKIQKNKQEIQNQMVIYCLCIAFQDTTCSIQWKLKNKYKNMNDVQNYVSLIQDDRVTTQKQINSFMDPLRDYNIKYQNGGFIKITGSVQVMSKLLLPRCYNKGNNNRTSFLFKYLASMPPKTSYTYQSSSVRQLTREVTILNDSINKINIRPIHTQDYMLITDKIFDSKGKYYMGACALVQSKVLILIKMMTAKNVMLQIHASGQFYLNVYINGYLTQLPFLLSNCDIEIIKELRRFNQQDSSKKLLQQPKLMQNSKRSKFLRLLTQTPLKPKMQQWTAIYDETVEKYKKIKQQPIPIQYCPKLRQPTKKNSYFQRYRKWKIDYQNQLYLNFKILTTKQCQIICSKCWPQQFTIIEDLKSFCTKKKVLQLNQYRGSWIKNDNNLLCARKHKFGHILNPDQGFVQFQNLLMYCPLRKTAKFDGQQQSIQQMLSLLDQGKYQLQQQKSKYYEFQCKLCSQSCHDYDNTITRCIIKKQQYMPTDKYWKKITQHMYSKKHLDNLERFCNNI